jgi:hypothetical protein
MQCANCEFENMPGVQACGRCGASLQLRAVAVGVYPPRASAWTKPWRRATWRLRWAMGRAAQTTVRRLLDRDFVYDGPAGPVVRRCVVPGWPQFYQGQRVRGCWFLGIFTAFVLVAIATLGTEEGAIWLGLAVAAHLSSALDVLLTATRGSDARWLHIAWRLLTLGAVTYLPLGLMVHFFFSPRQITRPIANFSVGDGVLVNSAVYYLRAPNLGDVVLYNLARIQVPGPFGTHTQYVIQGPQIDRIVAGPGQRVRIDDGVLFVDEKPAVNLPLNRNAMPKALATVVPPDHYFIVPSSISMTGMELQDRHWLLIGQVPRERIVGLVYARYWPWRSFELL